MLDLEIQYGDARSDVRQLSKSQPISIGRHGSNDICIDEPSVAPIHCRVLWNKTKTYFEVASANRDGVDLNGTLVRVSGLKEGDVLRIGSADLIVREREAAAEQPASRSPQVDNQWLVDAPILPSTSTASPKSEEIPFKPASEETLASLGGRDRRAHHSPPMIDREPKPAFDDREKRLAPLRHAPAAEPAPHAHSDEQEALAQQAAIEAMITDSEVPDAIWRRSGHTGHEESFAVRLSQRLSERRQVRPGEQEALRSPFILGMLGLTLTLVLAAGAIYLVIGREPKRSSTQSAMASRPNCSRNISAITRATAMWTKHSTRCGTPAC
jgi:FHA domain